MVQQKKLHPQASVCNENGMGAMRGGLSLLTLLTLVLLGLSFCGAWLPLGDTLAVGRLHLAALLVLAAPFLFKLRARRLALIALVSAVLASGQIVAGFSAADAVASGRYTLYQKNRRIIGKELSLKLCCTKVASRN